MAHVAENEIDLRREVSTTRVSGWVKDAGNHSKGFFNKLFRDIHSRDPIATPREFERQSAIPTRNIKQVRPGVALKRLDQEICFSLCVLRWNSLSPQIERKAVKKVFIPV